MKRQELAALLQSHSEAKSLLMFVFNLTSIEVILQQDFDDFSLKPYIERLQAGEPLARIIGHQEFYGHNFILNEATLIPRPDSETLVAAALELQPHNILDLGTGSGCLLISLLHALPKAAGVGIDISERALVAARMNADDLKAEFIQSDWFSHVTGTYDLIISNPPYIAKDEKLDESVLNHDPHLALFAQNNGLACYEIIFSKALRYLSDDGHVIVEIGFSQQQDVTNIAKKYHFERINITYDLGGHARALTFKQDLRR